jgi:hypothetical protein
MTEIWDVVSDCMERFLRIHIYTAYTHLQDRLSVWWTRNSSRDVEGHTGEEERVLIQLFAAFG